MAEPFSALSLIAAGGYSSSAGNVVGAPVTLRNVPAVAAFELRILAAPTSSGYSGATLDVYVQHSIDYLLAGAASSNFAASWDDFIHFPQQTAGSGAATQIAGWNGLAAPQSSMNFHSAASASLAVGQVIHGPTGRSWRALAAIGGTSSSQWRIQVIVQGRG